MTSKDSLQAMLAHIDEERAAQCLLRLKPDLREFLDLPANEQAFWLSVFPPETDVDELEGWEQGTAGDIDTIDA